MEHRHGGAPEGLCNCFFSSCIPEGKKLVDGTCNILVTEWEAVGAEEGRGYRK